MLTSVPRFYTWNSVFVSVDQETLNRVNFSDVYFTIFVHFYIYFYTMFYIIYVCNVIKLLTVVVSNSLFRFYFNSF
jgi:hypothetical protein